MTIQVLSKEVSTSKKALEEALNTIPGKVWFHNPSIFHDKGPHDFSGLRITIGESFPVVMDHPRRSRFATVTRLDDSSFKVK